MFCDCSRGEWRHHHAFGGTYPCAGPEACSRCKPEVTPVEFLAPAWPEDADEDDE